MLLDGNYISKAFSDSLQSNLDNSFEQEECIACTGYDPGYARSIAGSASIPILISSKAVQSPIVE